MDLHGVATAPDHFLGDFPRVKWNSFSTSEIPADLTGKTVLDIGCNAGFYAHRDEAARGRARARHRLRRRLPGPGTLRRRRGGPRHRVPPALGVRRGQPRRAFRHRVLHRRALSPPPPAAGARPDPPSTSPQTCWCSSPCSAVPGARIDLAPAITSSSTRRSFDEPRYPRLSFIEHSYAHDNTNWWAPNEACSAAMLRSAGFAIESHPESEVFICRRVPRAQTSVMARSIPPRQRREKKRMIEAAMIWNEPNNKSHWDLEADPGWAAFAAMARLAGEAIGAECPGLPRVLGGISPDRPGFHPAARRPGRAAAARRGRGARLPHGLEPLEAGRVAAEDWPRSRR